VRALASIRSSKSPGNSRRQKDGTAKGGIDAALRDGLGGSEARPPLRVVRVVVEVDAVEQQPGAE
jgi:hypothetical protein